MTKRVYFIKPVGMDGPIKIGCSQSPDTRRDTLAIWSPFPLEIIAELDGDFALEKQIHKSLWHLHERREWFRPDPVIDAIVAAINAGTFTPDMLPTDLPSNGNWRARKPVPEWTGKQTSLSGRVWRAEYHSGYRCPVNYRNLWREGREAHLPTIEQFIEEPHSNGIPCNYDHSVERRKKYHAAIARRKAA